MGLLLFITASASLLVGGLTVVLVREASRPPRRTAGYAIVNNLPCDPGDLGMPFEAWWLDRPGGVRLPVWEISTGAPGPRTPVVAIAHGWGQSRIDVLADLDRWRTRAARIALLDLRGHGDAEGAVSRLGASEGADLLALVRQLGSERVVLEGHSMGAIVAIHAAADDGEDQVAGVVAVAPYRRFVRSLEGRLATSGYPARPMSDLALAWWRATGHAFPDTAAVAARVRVPLLVVHGDADSISPPDDGEAIAAAAPRGTHLSVPGAGHGDVLVADRGAVDAGLERFLDDVERGPGEVEPTGEG